MKIIVQSDRNRLKKYKEFGCTKCGCVFIADNNEYRDTSSQLDGPLFAINCPCCNVVVYNNSYNYITHEEYIKFMER